MKSTKGKRKREYTVEFKVGAARRVMAGESVLQLSRELDVRRGLLYVWRDVYRAEGAAGLSRKRGRPRPGHAPPRAERDPREERIAELERLLGQQAAELDFFEQAFRALNLATPGHDASGASGSTRLSGGSTPKARSASKSSVRSAE